jgi:hypothetical protein
MCRRRWNGRESNILLLSCSHDRGETAPIDEFVGEPTFICSTDRGKKGPAQCSSSSGKICNTGTTVVTIVSLSTADGTKGTSGNYDELTPTQWEKQPKISAPLSSVEPTPISLEGHIASTIESLLRVASAHSRKLSTRTRQSQQSTLEGSVDRDGSSHDAGAA